MGNTVILWFAQAADDSGEFGSFNCKLMENLARFQRFAGCFGSYYQQARCLLSFQVVHWHFVPHGPRAAQCLRASMLVLDGPASPKHAKPFRRLVKLYTVGKVCLYQI